MLILFYFAFVVSRPNGTRNLRIQSSSYKATVYNCCTKFHWTNVFGHAETNLCFVSVEYVSCINIH